MAGLLDLEEERRKSLASASPNSIAGLLGQTGARQGNNLLSMAKEHFANLPQTIENNQRQLDRSMAGMFKTDIITGQPNPAYYPEAINEVTQMLPGFMGATAFHGSPYRFDKFDLAKVGAGEGAQMYGHGMYFAEHPAVAKPYSLIEPSGMSATPNRQLFGKDVEPTTPEYKVSQLVDEMGVAKAKKFVADWAKDPLPNQIGYVENLQSIISNVAKKSDAKNLGASNMYKVDIPDEKIPKMLNWDVPLSEQSKAVQDIAWKYKDALKNQTEVKGLKNIWELDGADLYGVMQRYKIEDGGKLARGNVDIKDVSDIMNKSDIPGIRYMNYQGKTSEGANTSNYVVFDPTDVKILERNKKKVGLLD